MSLAAITARSEDVLGAMDDNALTGQANAAFTSLDTVNRSPDLDEVSLLYEIADEKKALLEPVVADKAGVHQSVAALPYQTTSTPIAMPAPTPTLDFVSPQSNTIQTEQEKSWWDNLYDWFVDFWNRLDERVRGVLRAIGMFVLGIAVLFAIAGIAFLILVALGVSVTFGAVLLVVGLCVLALFLGFQIGWRFAEMCSISGDQPWYVRVQQLIGACFIGFGDVIGVTGLIEAFTGKEILSQKDINQEERWYRGTLSFLTIATLFLGRSLARQGGKKAPVEIVEEPKKPLIEMPEVPKVTSRTLPSGRGQLLGKPTAIDVVKMDIETIRGLTRENESANLFAKNGYDVYQNPGRINGKDPDLLLEGKVFDVYSPSSSNPRNIAGAMEGKILSGQTNRIVLNLEDSPVSIDVLKAQLEQYPIEGLEEVIIIKDGKIIHFFPF